jgi:Intracellular proteinase inhibitor
MLGIKTSTLSLLLAGALFGQVEYLPLQTGNQWVYRGAAGQFTVAVERGSAFEGRDYFLVKGFPSTPEVYLRNDGAGRVWMWDGEAKRERVWLDFTADEAPTGVDPCNALSRVESREAKYSGPVGEFVNALRVRYTIAGCADTGVDSDLFLPYVGLVQRMVQTIAGPRAFELVYARLGEVAVITEPEVSFGVAVDRGAKAVRLTLRNTTGVPLELNFGSSQSFDVVVRDEEGKDVWQWSSTRSFIQVLRNEQVSGERLWVVALPELKAGRYSVEGWLTTMGVKRFAATAGIELRP